MGDSNEKAGITERKWVSLYEPCNRSRSGPHSLNDHKQVREPFQSHLQKGVIQAHLNLKALCQLQSAITTSVIVLDYFRS